MSSLRKIALPCRHCGAQAHKTMIMLTFIDRFTCEGCAGITTIARDLLPALDAIENAFKDLDSAVATLRGLTKPRAPAQWDPAS